jgi:hypothetical protein
MARSINRARPERELVKRSRYGRFNSKCESQAAIYDDPERSAPKTPRQIPIRVVDAHPYAHHPARPADIRAVLARLSGWTLNGLSEIHLCRGAEADPRPAQDTIEPTHELDPWIGRRGYEMLPGVYCGQLLGQFSGRPNRLHIYSIVYDPALPDRAMWEVLLRRDVLATLVHEIGHHHWRYQRFPSGSRPDSEAYASKYEYAGIKTHVLPYLEEAYPAEVDRLLSWVEGHIGVRLTLASLQPDREDAGASAFSGFTAGSAIEHLVEALAKGDDPREIRLDFARNIHYGGKYDEASQILDLLLAEDPDDFEALDPRSCILRDQKRFVEGEAFTRELTVRFPTERRPWDRLATFRRRLHDWDGVVEALIALLALPDLRFHVSDEALVERAQAYSELGALEAALADLDRVSARISPSLARDSAKLRAEIEEKRTALVP